ncbi:MAG TPA: serine/threonine-protein kinase, partial [Burkholderiales bacterium]|nr:serine/threonine-protein kinase [Burkholderiales bacterium]
MPELTKLGKYQIRRELGKGAMGIVYEGFDPLIERIVAIKTIRPEQLEPSQAAEILARFKREAQAAGRLNHPNIVAIYEYGEDAGGAPESRISYIAMEFIKGRELRNFFDGNQKFPLKEIERIMGEILDALRHAHEHGVTHRDIKPANVILLDDGRVKVADFGIARIETSELTQAGTILGTPSYMSPEQFLGQPVDGRSDIFSCGVILYQFLTGEKPFTGAVTTIMHKVLKEEPLPPSMLNATLPHTWDAVIKKAIAKNPADRYQTATEFSKAIKAAFASQAAESTVINLAGDATTVNEPALVERTVPNARVDATAAAAPPPRVPAAASAPAVALSASSRTRSNLAVLAGVAGAGVIAAGVVAYMFLPGRDPSVTETAPVAQNSPIVPAAVDRSAAASKPPTPPAPVEASVEPGTMVISALGLVDPKDPKFNGDQAAAQAEARADAKRQLVEKA